MRAHMVAGREQSPVSLRKEPVPSGPSSVRLTKDPVRPAGGVKLTKDAAARAEPAEGEVRVGDRGRRALIGVVLLAAVAAAAAGIFAAVADDPPEASATVLPPALAVDLDRQLGPRWETDVRGMVTTAEPMVAKAYLVGTWWAVGDYCRTAATPAADCDAAALSYLRLRLGPKTDTVLRTELAGAVATAFDMGYNASAADLGLPPVAPQSTGEHRPTL